MRTLLVVGVFLLLALLSAGCATLSPGYEKPQINVTSFAVAPESVGLAPRFNIGIQVINPNRTALPLKGMTYALEIEGNRVLSGATADLPRVPAYGMADFMIEASPDLLGSARLLGDLFAHQRDSFAFTFKGRLDVGSLMPFIHFEESGRFGLAAPTR